MSIYDNVAAGLKLNGTRNRKTLDEAVERSLQQSALWDEVKDKLHKSAYAISGGQQQRLCIARALAVDPEVLLLDEPSSALDPIATAKIEELLFDLKDVCTIIIVTHNMQQAARVADSTAFFLMGELIVGANGRALASPDDLHEAIANSQGGVLDIEFVRGDRRTRRHAEIEEEKVQADLARNPHHAKKGEDLPEEVMAGAGMAGPRGPLPR